MTCAHCGAAAVRVQVGPNQQAWESPCRRRLVETKTQGAQWMPMGGYCPNCKGETWRFVTHPTFETRIPLWPMPASLTVHHWTPAGSAIHGTFCATCCPKFGTAACTHVLHEAPEAGGVIDHAPSRDRYTARFTESYGRWLRAWLSDELRLEEPERDRLVAQWEADRGHI